MNTAKQTGGPAFPVPGLQEYEEFNGMTLRDYFAVKALPAILAQDENGITAYAPGSKFGDGSTAAQNWARNAYEIADAMLAARGAA
jgi:hypothetical protein